ncbi:MAG: MvaI/BcnI family restriction endonuclease [Aquidulcibacter sp.]
MLEKSDKDIGEALKAFNAFELDIGLIVPTKTAMEKSIIDATASVRDYLVDTKFHDYEMQGQGKVENGIEHRAFFVWPDRLEQTTASFYRPNTKNGDPRLWLYKLKGYAEPFNLLALLVDDGTLYVVNCSKPELLDTLHDPSTPLGELAAKRRPLADPAVDELLEMMRAISRKGFVPTLRPGDTGIGMTLETLLGIKANANRSPDYKGIEIKAKRVGGRSDNRSTLFSQVPNWNLSPIGSAWNLLSSYGYERNGKLRLNHEIDARGPNSIGFFLEVDANRDWLKQSHLGKGEGNPKHIVTWEMAKLRQRLAEKHPQTFWVDARVRGGREAEEFHYVQVRHTRKPKVRNLEVLLEGGLISVDYLMSQKKPDVRTVRDHGYLFKIHPNNLDALFPPSDVHLLVN